MYDEKEWAILWKMRPPETGGRNRLHCIQQHCEKLEQSSQVYENMEY